MGMSLEKMPVQYNKIMDKQNSSRFYFFPESCHQVQGVDILMSWHPQFGEQLILIANEVNEVFRDFEGCEYLPDPEAGVSFYLKVAPKSEKNAAMLRKYFAWTAPVPVLRRKCSFGCGDRLGVATSSHARVFKQYEAAPVFAQQSIRELNLTNRTYRKVIDDATFQVFQAGYHDGFGADGDHLKSFEHIRMALEAGVTMLTLDLSDELHPEFATAQVEDLEKAYAEVADDIKQRCENSYLKTIALSSGELTFSREELMRCVLIYTQAMNFAEKVGELLTELGGGQVDLEVSIDETSAPTLPEHHYFVASELLYRKVRFESLAPRFVGEFQKGIDYIGDLQEFEKQFKQHVDIAETFGSYKLSVHSGSDKFSVFPIIGRLTKGKFHLKTAGTSWLEAGHAIAMQNPVLFRKMVKRAFETLNDARKYYHVTADFASLPALDTVQDQDLIQFLETIPGRQLIHITYGFMLGSDPELRAEIFSELNRSVLSYDACLKKHFERHLDLLGISKRQESTDKADFTLAKLVGLEQKSFTGSNGAVLNYCQLVNCPEQDGEFALIMFMHGAGERGNDNWLSLRHAAAEITDYLQRRKIKAVLLIPQCPVTDKWVDAPWDALAHQMNGEPTLSMQLAMELLDSEIIEKQVDKQKIYITGLSMGGFATWELLQRRPGFFAASMPVCGGADTGFAAQLKDEKIMVYHGAQDAVVLPSRSRDMVQALQEAGNHNVRYTELPGVGHNAWDYAYCDEALDWMFSMKLGE